jgi:hypothetical protein
LLQALAFVWASPYTLVGLVVGGAGLCVGARARIRGRTIEFYGGGLAWLLHRMPDGPFIMAFTFGHTIFGPSPSALDAAREHELVHVRQFERWGPFMGPAYLLCSLYLWLAGGRPYRDNPFEREAYGDAGD